MKELHVAQGLWFPLETVTQTIGILARKRMGKSFLARRLSEQLIQAGQQVVIVDPKGDWWGIRSAADGKREGLPVVILGGERGDVKLEVGGGEVVARLIVEERVSVLLDLSLFRKHEVATFMSAFLESLYRQKALEKNRTPCMLVVDEADAIAPQKPQHGEERMLGAIDDVVRRGGQRGLGCTLVSQRSAVLNKNVLTQVQMLVALRTISPQDLAAMNAWIDVHGTPEERHELMESLPSLPVGTAWYWSPGWPTEEGIFKKAKTLVIDTFDSGATPKPGEKRVEPKKLAEVDIAAVSRQMAETIERAKADDPKELRKRIAELERNLKAARLEKVKLEPSIVERPVFNEGGVDSLQADLNQQLEAVDGLLRATRKNIDERIDAYRKQCRSAVAQGEKGVSLLGVPQLRNAKPEREYRAAKANGSSELKPMHRAMLTALAQHTAGLTKKKILVHTGYAASGPVSNSFAYLNQAGYAYARDGKLMITPEGLDALGSFDPLPIGDDLREFLLSGDKLSGMEKALLREICGAYPNSLRKSAVIERAGYAASGPVSNAFARLVAYGYVTQDGPNFLKAAEELFS